MKNLKEVSERIKKAVDDNEKIVLYGDADLDGVTSVVILEEAIGKIGGRAVVYISDRENWGYGLSKEAVLNMKKESPALLISLDCGISNFEGAETANKEGFDFVIIDHHKTQSKLPKASLILDPLQEGDRYPFKKLANAGVVYKLTQEMLGKDFPAKKNRFLEMVVLATIADMVPKEADNKKFLEEGLGLLEDPSITSLAVLKERTEENFVEYVTSLLNVTKAKGTANNTYFFFKEDDPQEIENLINEIKVDYEKRKQEIKVEEERISEKVDEDSLFIFEEGSFPSSLAGSVASKIIKKHGKTVFLYAREDGIASGSVRVVVGQDAVEMMTHCKKYLESFGGHPEAAGFMLKEENIENFKNCLTDYFCKYLNN